MIAQTRLRDPAPGTKLALDDHVTHQHNQLVVKGSAENGRMDGHKEELPTPATFYCRQPHMPRLTSIRGYRLAEKGRRFAPNRTRARDPLRLSKAAVDCCIQRQQRSDRREAQSKHRRGKTMARQVELHA